MNEIIEADSMKITFNFFSKENCTGFRFCNSYTVRTNFLYELLQLTPEERLVKIQPFLERGPKGKSAEFYFNGEFVLCGNVTEKKENQKKRAKGIKNK